MNANGASAASTSSEVMPQQNPAREIRAGDAVARIAEREQMMREIPVRTDVRQPVAGARVRRVPAVRGQDAGDVGIERRQLVHQLTGSLHDHLARAGAAAAIAHRRPHEQPLVVHPSNDVRRRRARRGRPQSRRPSWWRIFAGTGSVSARYEVRNQKWRASDSKSARRHAGRDDDAVGADRAAGREDVGVLAVERDPF